MLGAILFTHHVCVCVTAQFHAVLRPTVYTDQPTPTYNSGCTETEAGKSQLRTRVRVAREVLLDLAPAYA